MLAPESAELRGRLGMAYDANGFGAAAVEMYRQAAQLDPYAFRWPYLAALALGAQADLESALGEMDRALSIDDRFAAAWLWRGAWLLEQDAHDLAKEAYLQARALADDQATEAAARTWALARVLLREGDAGGAVAVLEETAARFAHPYVRQMLAGAYRRSGAVDDARALDVGDGEVEKLSWPDPHTAERSKFVRGFSGQMQVAQKMLRDREPRAALEILTQLLEQEPTDRDLLNNLSIAYKQLGRREDALSTLEQGLQTYPEYQLFSLQTSR